MVNDIASRGQGQNGQPADEVGKSKAPKVPRVWVSSLKFNDGTALQLSEGEILLIVGPNNAGKSALLRDIFQALHQRNNQKLVLTDLTIDSVGTPEEFEEWALSKGKIDRTGSYPSLHLLGSSFMLQHLPQVWANVNNGLGNLAELFSQNLTTQARLTSANPVPVPDLTRRPPTHPLHRLYRSDALELEISGIFHRAFGEDLVMNRLGGSHTGLHVGARPSLSAGENLTSETYIEAVEKLSRLDDQGDGMRSFVGVILNAFASEHQILLIDEPDAFLHPPQARLLGQMLAKNKPHEQQLFLATHSGDFLRGIIDADSEHVCVVRVRREGRLNVIRKLSSRLLINA